MFLYKDLLNEVQQFCNHGIETGVVGTSELGQTIPYIFVGQKNGNYMIVQAAMHAREHLTALVCVCLAKYIVANPNLKLDGGIYFVPMSNPDGVRLCQEGIGWITDETVTKTLVDINQGKTDFSMWKANARGVDINVNFDAEWGEGQQNVFEPSPQNFIGSAPCSACETRALVDFTLRIKPCVTLSYHLKGEEIYWQFNQPARASFRDRKYAQAIAAYTRYSLVSQQGSAGGYKDWCVQELGIPAYTIEVGADIYPHPFPYSQLSNIVKQNQDLPRRLLNTVVRDRARLSEVSDYDDFFSNKAKI